MTFRDPHTGIICYSWDDPEDRKAMIAELAKESFGGSRDRPYDGQSHTDNGERGKTLVEGLTMRDIADCIKRGSIRAGDEVSEALRAEFLQRHEPGPARNAAIDLFDHLAARIRKLEEGQGEGVDYDALVLPHPKPAPPSDGLPAWVAEHFEACEWADALKASPRGIWRLCLMTNDVGEPPWMNFIPAENSAVNVIWLRVRR